MGRDKASRQALTMISDLIGKQLQLLKEVVPRATRIGIISLGSQAGPQMKEAEVVGRRLGLTLHRIAVREPLTLDDLAPQLRTARVDAVLAVANPALDDVRTRIVEIINAQRLPSVFTLTYWAEAGGAHELLCGSLCRPATRGDVRRQNSEGRDPGHPAHRAADKARAYDQSQNGEDAWHRPAAAVVATGGSGDRMMKNFTRQQTRGSRCSPLAAERERYAP